MRRLPTLFSFFLFSFFAERLPVLICGPSRRSVAAIFHASHCVVRAWGGRLWSCSRESHTIILTIWISLAIVNRSSFNCYWCEVQSGQYMLYLYEFSTCLAIYFLHSILRPRLWRRFRPLSGKFKHINIKDMFLYIPSNGDHSPSAHLSGGQFVYKSKPRPHNTCFLLQFS